MTPQFPVRFSWLRETAPGRLEADLDLRLSSDELPLALAGIHPRQQSHEQDCGRLAAQLDGALASWGFFESLPVWLRERLRSFFGPLNSPALLEAARANLDLIRQVSEVAARKAAGVAAAAEIHLPYFNRKSWLRRFDRLGEIVFEVNADGRVLDRSTASDPVAHGMNAMTMVLATALKPASSVSGPTVAAAAKGSVSTGRSRLALGPILSDFGMENALDGHTEPLEATLILRAPGGAGTAWADTPVGRRADFIPVYSRFSAQIQLALRRWLAWFFFSGSAAEPQWNTALALLAYRVTKPFLAQTRSGFSYDVLDHRKMSSLCAAAARKLQDGPARYGAGGWPQSRDILDLLQNDTRLFPSLLFSEAQIVDECLCLAQRIRPHLRPQQISRSVEEFSGVLDRKLRVLLRRCGVFAVIPPVMIIEILAAMSVARGGPGPELELKLASAAKTSLHRNTLTRFDSLSSM